MSFRFCFLLIAFLLLLSTAPSSAQSPLILDDTLTINSPVTFSYVIITSTGRLTANDSITVIGDMTINSGGIVTHSPRLLKGLRLRVMGTLDVQTQAE